jgi:hypothetical protein
VAFIDVERVERQPVPSALRWFAVDLPMPPTTVEGREVEVVGWALADDGGVRALELSSDGQVLVRTRLNALRPDLAIGFPEVPDADKAGFRAVVPMPPVPSADIALDALLADGSRAALAVISLRRRWRAARDERLQRLVSVVVPCFNQAHFLSEALESVLTQSYPDIEVVVVDDGSTDNTAAVVSRFPTVRYVRQDNAGAAAARNTGLRITNGDLLTFLDADDALHPDAIAVGVDALRQHPSAAFVFGHAVLSMDDGGDAPPPHRPSFDDDYHARLLAGCPIVSNASVMFRRAAFQAVGPFDASLRHLEDYDLYHRIVRSYPVHCHGQVVALYRRHGGNATSAGGVRALRDAMEVLGRQAPHLGSDPALRAAHRAGKHYWAGHLGRLVARQVQGDLAAKRWGSAGRGLLALLRWWPRGLATVVRSPRRMSEVPEWRPEA